MKDADGKRLVVGDIVQMKPDAVHGMYRTCIGVVTELKSFGAIVDFMLPGYGIAPLRVSSAEMVVVGRIVYAVR